jgi:nitrite reductase/ring-hydroxylating ferredoxin subunit
MTPPEEKMRGKAIRAVHSSTAAADPRKEIPELGFREYWYPAVSVRKISSRRPFTIKLLGEEICLFKAGETVAAISDVCPHRGTSISGGRCHFPGTVSCPYHGWTFNPAGDCVAVLSEGPHSKVPGRVRVRSYPTSSIKGIVFIWMGESEPPDIRHDLPPELFDESLVYHDCTYWQTNWRLALENLRDNHAPYLHRNSLSMLMRPLGKISNGSSRAVYCGGGVRLSTYDDGKRREAPYREYFPSLSGYWPKTSWRRLWTWAFRYPPLCLLHADRRGRNARSGAYNGSAEWDMGPHMPGMQRISRSRTMYTRWCVPVEANLTREFFFHAIRPHGKFDAFIERLRYPIALRLLYYRNLAFQDGKNLQRTRYDSTERFSDADIETIGWRKLAILSARYSGRHDKIPADVIKQLNNE